jgi:hypothetical protein
MTRCLSVILITPSFRSEAGGRAGRGVEGLEIGKHQRKSALVQLVRLFLSPGPSDPTCLTNEIMTAGSDFSSEAACAQNVESTEEPKSSQRVHRSEAPPRWEFQDRWQGDSMQRGRPGPSSVQLTIAGIWQGRDRKT